jgi:putative tricarboxylic transport membrane protein
MDLLHNLYTGFTIALTGQNLLCCTVGVLFGQLIGVLPGIGAPTAIALLLPLTFSFNPTSAIIMFAGSTTVWPTAGRSPRSSSMFRGSPPRS